MRLALLLLLVPSAAYADGRADDSIGVFVGGEFGGVDYRGDIAAMGGGAPAMHMSLGVRRGQWTVSVGGGGADPYALFIDCYGDECNAPTPASYAFGTIDIKRAWPLFNRPWRHAGIRMFLHGGPRWFSGGGAIDGYSGPGVGGGAGIEGDAFVIGYYVDFGMDVFRLTSPQMDDAIHGSTPYVMVGSRFGWM
jgi:hypothetical protein